MKENAPLIWSEKANGYKGIWFTLGQFSTHGDKYSGGLGTYTAQHTPLAIHAPEVNKTFFVYGGAKDGQRHLLLMAGSFDHGTGEVSQPTIVYDKQGVDDPHDNPSLALDSAGYLWVFVAGRNRSRPGVVLKSTAPHSIDAFEELYEFPAMTYPQPIFNSQRGEFGLLFTKYTNGRELYFATSSDGKSWSPHLKLAGFGGHYQISSFNPATGKIGTFFNYHPGGDVNARTNLYYMESSDFGETWTTAAGAHLSLPLDDPDNPALVVDLASENLLMYNCDISWDAAGNPLLLYVVPRDFRPGPDGDPREWRLTQWTGSEWKTSTITTSTHAYDVGSILVDGDRWTVIGPTGTGPQPWGTGGEMEVWTSENQGNSWSRQRTITRNSEFNHAYARRVLNAVDPFAILWADGNPDTFSESRLYFSDHDGMRFWQLPYSMTDSHQRPIKMSSH